MIPDFKTYIGESVWADIHRRSNGDQIRKEDDVNNFDINEFCDYLNSRYIFYDRTGHQCKVEVIDETEEIDEDNEIVLYLFEYDNNGSYDDCIFVYSNSGDVVECGIKCSSKKYAKMFFDSLTERFDDISTERQSYELLPSYVMYIHDLTNNKVINILDFIIDNIKEPLKKFIEKR